MKLQLIYPLNPPVVITQLFGQNAWFYADPKYGGVIGHNGEDYQTSHGQPVYATHDGFASYQIDSAGGHGVVIITDKEWEDVDGVSSYWKSVYWHLCDGTKEPKYLSPFMGKAGYTKVECGDLIGYSDNTGASTGTHLHYSIKPVAKGEAWGTWYNLEQKNGYNGAVNPAPYYDKNYPVTVELLKKQISALQMLIELWTTLFNKSK
jgi:murein DD-endopeptidase MepM/ murein hydrolase activator NlpD